MARDPAPAGDHRHVPPAEGDEPRPRQHQRGGVVQAQVAPCLVDSTFFCLSFKLMSGQTVSRGCSGQRRCRDTCPVWTQQPGNVAHQTSNVLTAMKAHHPQTAAGQREGGGGEARGQPGARAAGARGPLESRERGHARV